MRLMNPGPGEIMDRMTILDLKIAAAKNKKRPTDHFEEERKLCSQALLKIVGPKFAADMTTKRYLLAAVNKMIWDAEDQVRALPSEALAKLAILAKKIPALNDQRAKLIHEANALVGLDAQEKMYNST